MLSFSLFAASPLLRRVICCRHLFSCRRARVTFSCQMLYDARCHALRHARSHDAPIDSGLTRSPEPLERFYLMSMRARCALDAARACAYAPAHEMRAIARLRRCRYYDAQMRRHCIYAKRRCKEAACRCAIVLFHLLAHRPVDHHASPHYLLDALSSHLCHERCHHIYIMRRMTFEMR